MKRSLLVLSALLLASVSLAATVAEVKKKGVLVLGTDPTFAPFEFAGPSLQASTEAGYRMALTPPSRPSSLQGRMDRCRASTSTSPARWPATSACGWRCVRWASGP